MKVVVTGGSGKIGLPAMKSLQKAGHEVTCFDCVPPKTGDFKYIQGNIKNRKDVDNALRGMDAVIHYAAYPYEGAGPTYSDTWDVNDTGTFNVFEFSVKNNIKKVVYASSITATGVITWVTHHSIEYFPVDELHPCRPQDLYGTGKLISEKLASMYAIRSNTSFIGLRFACVWFGHPDFDERTKMILDKYVRDPAKIFEVEKKEGPLVRDLVYEYVGEVDAVEASILALEKEGVKCDIYNIGAADSCSEWDSIKLAKFLYPEVPLRNPLAFVIDKKKPLFDISKAQRELGYRPKFNWREFM